jgi:hypothetical protein
MPRVPEAVSATLEVLRSAGYQPTFEQTKKHFKVRAPGLPLIVCAGSASDWRSRVSAVTLAKRLIRQAGAQK